MFGLGVGEIAAIAILVLVLFGGRKLPQLRSGLAKGIQNFKRGLREGNHSEHTPTKNNEDE